MNQQAPRRPSGRGKFITFEGGEGSGKSTQIKKLAERLAKARQRAIVTREPGGSPGAEIVRHVVLSGAARPLGPVAEAVLFAAARRDHLENLIKPALSRGKWVVCDRFLDSTRVYQGILDEVGRPFIKGLEKLTVGDALPDITFILDIPAEIGLARARERRAGAKPDRFEREDLGFHERLNAAFRDIAKEEPQRCVLINANRTKDQVAAEIWMHVKKRLAPESAPVSAEALL
jgi:dTMP kinase